MRVSEYQETYPPDNFLNKLLLATTTGLAGALCGTILAYLAAKDNKGVSQRDMQEYVISHDDSEKRANVEHTTHQDEQIGELKGAQKKNSDNLSDLKYKVEGHDRDITEIRSDLKTKMGIAADIIEKGKR
jgi:hypothetical protein